MKTIFEHPAYTPIMTILLLSTSLLIVFNFIKLFEALKIKITGFVIVETNHNPQLTYYFLIAGILIAIVITAIKLKNSLRNGI